MNKFFNDYKKILMLVVVTTFLLVICLFVEAFTAGGKNLKNDFIFQPKIFIASMYSLGIMFCGLIPLGFAKVYYGNLVNPPSHDDDMKLISQISLSILCVTLILFMGAILTDYLIGTPILMALLIVISIVIFKTIALILAIIAITLLLINVFHKWIAPSVSWTLGKTWGVGIIGFFCLIFLLATCNGIKNMNQNDFIPGVTQGRGDTYNPNQPPNSLNDRRVPGNGDNTMNSVKQPPDRPGI